MATVAPNPTRGEFIDWLVNHLATWPKTVIEAHSILREVVHAFPDHSIHAQLRLSREVHVVFYGGGENTWSVCEGDWLEARKAAINEPSWDEAPDWAVSKHQDADGRWYWDEGGSEAVDAIQKWYSPDFQKRVKLASVGRCPPGHDWRKTLETRVRPVQMMPPMGYAIDELSKAARGIQDAIRFQFPWTGEEINRVAQNLEARRREHYAEQHRAKQERYLDDDEGDDWIDECARTFTREEFKGAMRFTIGKYNRRMGKKDDMLKEVRKMKDYCERWEEYLIRVEESDDDE